MSFNKAKWIWVQNVSKPDTYGELGDAVLRASGENIRARYSRAYTQGMQKLVTRQLGLSFCYFYKKTYPQASQKIHQRQRAD